MSAYVTAAAAAAAEANVVVDTELRKWQCLSGDLWLGDYKFRLSRRFSNALLAAQVQRLNGGQPLKPIDGDDGDNDRQTQQTEDVKNPDQEQIDKINEQRINEAIVFSRSVGKLQIMDGQTTEDLLPDVWTFPTMTEKEQMELAMTIEDARLAQMAQEMRRMQRIIEDLKDKTEFQPPSS